MANLHDFTRIGITYRQLDHWTNRGWLHAEDRPSATSGVPRTWPAGELEVAHRMAVLINAGVTPEAAHHAARHDGELPGGAIRVQWLPELVRSA